MSHPIIPTPFSSRSERVAHAEQFLRYVFASGQTFEIRGLPSVASSSGNIVSGLFQSSRIAAATAFKMNEDLKVNVYFTLNPVTRRAPGSYIHHYIQNLRRQYDKAYRLYNQRLVQDADCERRHTLLIDCDPVRPTGVPSTDDELRAAFETASKISNALESLLGSSPMIVCSGNGFHLLFRSDDQTASHENGDAISFLLKKLSEQYSTPQVTVDTRVSNAARICRLPGFMNRRGPELAERPWRDSRVFSYPPEWKPCSPVALAQKWGWTARPIRPLAAPGNVTGDIVGDLIDTYPEHLIVEREVAGDGCTRYYLSECPMVGRPHSCHTATTTSLTLRDGRLYFNCFAEGCAGVDYRKMIEHLEDETGKLPDRIALIPDTYVDVIARRCWGVHDEYEMLPEDHMLSVDEFKAVMARGRSLP